MRGSVTRVNTSRCHFMTSATGGSCHLHMGDMLWDSAKYRTWRQTFNSEATGLCMDIQPSSPSNETEVKLQRALTVLLAAIVGEQCAARLHKAFIVRVTLLRSVQNEVCAVWKELWGG